MSDRGVQFCGSRLHLSTLFLGSWRAGSDSDSTISCSANTWFSMKLKSTIKASLFHLFLVWHVEPKARRKQVGQHGLQVSSGFGPSSGCPSEEETWQPGIVGPRHLATPSGKPRLATWHTLAGLSKCVWSIQTILVRSPPVALFPHVRVASQPTVESPSSAARQS